MIGQRFFRKGKCFLTLTGCTTSPSAEFHWRIYGDDLVHLALAATASSGTLSATSNTTAMTLTGLPSEIIPVTDVVVPCHALDNGAGVFAMAFVGVGSSTVRLDRGVVSGTALTNSSTGWTNSGTKGIGTYWQMIYRLRKTAI